MSAPDSRVLVTRPVNDPLHTPPGFDDIYWCDACSDYYVLAWHPAEPAPARPLRVVPPRKPGEDLVFCPGCQAPYEDQEAIALWQAG